MMWSNPKKSYGHDRQKRKKGNPKSAEHIEFENWLKNGRSCQVPGCGLPAEEAHHAPFLSQGGTHDSRVGLCGAHHNENSQFVVGIHHMSRLDGNILMGCDIEQLARDNWQEFKNAGT